MKTKEIIFTSSLIGIGTLLNMLFPPLFFGMKPDFTLLILFLVIILSRKLKISMITSVAVGIICALTTNFPGGQIPNISDKIISGFIVYLVVSKMGLISYKKSIPIILLGSVTSGIIFLIVASLLVRLPAPISVMIATVIVPLAILNTIVFLPIYVAVEKSHVKNIYN